LSGASGLLTQRTTSGRDEVDRQLIECLSDETVSKDYLYNPKINQCTLTFTRHNLEVAYRDHYADSNLPADGSTLTLAVPSYSSLFDMIVSVFFFILIVIGCFVAFNIRILWLVVCLVGLFIQAAILLPMLGNLCLSRTFVIPAKLIHFLSSWYPRHLFGVFITSLPTIAAFSTFCCHMFLEIELSDRFCCLLVITTLLHYCNFTMLSSWMKSSLATAAGIFLLILLGIGFCSKVIILPTDNSTLDISNSTASSPDDVYFKSIFSDGEMAVKLEIILDVVLLLLLIWFLNREIEISYRLCFHGDVEAVLDRKKIQVWSRNIYSLM